MIADVDLYKYDPWQLLEKSPIPREVMVLLHPWDRKYSNGSRPNRVAVTGYWKAKVLINPSLTKEERSDWASLVFYARKTP